MARRASSEARESAGKANAALRTVIYTASGAAAARSNSTAVVEPGGSIEVAQELAIDRPALWTPEYPTLYRAVTQVVLDGETVDEVSTPFGVRSLE
jgi:beta-galactosidase